MHRPFVCDHIYFVFIVSLFSTEFHFVCFPDADAKTSILLGEWSAIVVTRRALLKAKASRNLSVDHCIFHFFVAPCCFHHAFVDHRPVFVLQQNVAAVWKGPPSTAGPVKKIFVGGLNPSGKQCLRIQECEV